MAVYFEMDLKEQQSLNRHSLNTPNTQAEILLKIPSQSAAVDSKPLN